MKGALNNETKEGLLNFPEITAIFKLNIVFPCKFKCIMVAGFFSKILMYCSSDDIDRNNIITW